MNTNISAAGLRRWAAHGAERANDPMTTGPEYKRLTKMKAALLELAETQEWLVGQKTALERAS